MKSLFALFLMITSIASVSSANSIEALRFDGKTSDGRACTLFVDHWYYSDADIQDWRTLQVYVRTPWQKQGNPALLVQRSHTQFSLYGKNPETRDQIAISLPWGAKTPEKIDHFLFQTWDQERGLVQESCRFH
jgi:hypothetical protein